MEREKKSRLRMRGSRRNYRNLSQNLDLLEDSATDANVSGEWALLVDVGTF